MNWTMPAVVKEQLRISGLSSSVLWRVTEVTRDTATYRILAPLAGDKSRDKTYIILVFQKISSTHNVLKMLLQKPNYMARFLYNNYLHYQPQSFKKEDNK